MVPESDTPGDGETASLQRLENEALYRAVVENAPVAVYIDQDIEGVGQDRPLFISPQIEVMLGWTPEEWLATPSMWWNSVHPDDKPGIEIAAEAVAESFDFEYRIKHRDGHWVWIREMARIIDSEGDTDLWHGVMLDISASKEAEDRLVETQEQLRSLIDNIPAVVYVGPADENASSTFVSPKIEEILGVTPEDYVADPDMWRRLTHPDDLARLEADYRSFLETGQPESSDYRIVRPDGRVVWVNDRASILRNESGEPFLTQGLIHDITDQKVAEAARDFQGRLLESISDAVISCDQKMNVTSWNRAAQVLYGWSAEDMIGNPLPEALRYDPSTLSAIWDPFVEEMRGWRGNTVHRDRDGYEISIETKGLPLTDTGGDLTGYVMVNREVAES